MACCLTHGKDWMDQGVCMACEEEHRSQVEKQRHQDEQRELENQAMYEHFQHHPHG